MKQIVKNLCSGCKVCLYEFEEREGKVINGSYSYCYDCNKKRDDALLVMEAIKLIKEL